MMSARSTRSAAHTFAALAGADTWSRQIGVHHGQDLIARQLPERAVYLGKLSRTDVLLFVWGGGQDKLL